MSRIVIIDANNLIYRSFYAMKPLSTSAGICVNAVYGALKIVKGIIQELRPDFLCLIWDNGKKTFRSNLDQNYKAQRPATPDNLKTQFKLLQEAFDCLGIPQITAPTEIEGDDTTASLATMAAKIGMEAVIVSADKDFFSLCGNPLIKVYSYSIAKKNPKDALVDANYIRKTYFVEPHQLNHIKALTGESADNIQGLDGIGPKTATKLIQEYGTLENLLNHLKKNPTHKYYNIYEQRHIPELAFKLATIKTNVEFEEVPMKPVDRIKIDEEKLKAFFTKLEMNSFLKENFPHWKNLFNYTANVS